MNHDWRETACVKRAARAIAVTGAHRDWRGVQAQMVKLGYENTETWFSDPNLRDGIDALCATSVETAARLHHRVEYLTKPGDPNSVCWTFLSLEAGIDGAVGLARAGLADVRQSFNAKGFWVLDNSGAVLAEEWA